MVQLFHVSIVHQKYDIQNEEIFPILKIENKLPCMGIGQMTSYLGAKSSSGLLLAEEATLKHHCRHQKRELPGATLSLSKLAF